jgi:predicted nucleic acid-binding protein
VSSNPQIIRDAVAPREALALLQEITAVAHHQFWPDDLSITDDAVPTALMMGHRQVSDAYLLGLAIRHNGRLVTLDRSIESLLLPNSAQLQFLDILPPDPV